MRLLVAILSAFALAGAALAAYAHSLPAQSLVAPELSYDVLPAEDKMASVEFLSAALTPESLLVLGSSELTAGSYVMSEHPTVFFREHNIGYSPMLVGSAHTQSLQLALYAGALAPSLTEKKVVLMVSPQWFATSDIAPQAFRSRFSLEVYRRFLENEAISDSTRNRVMQRLTELEVDPAVLGAASPQSPIDEINRLCFAGLDDLRLRYQVESVRQSGYLPTSQTLALEQHPDWQAWYDQASLDGAAACTNNSFGIDSDYYTTYIGSDPTRFAGTDADVSFLDSREYDDLELFLDICEEAGLEPLVVMVPVNGRWYDHTGMSADMRATYYENIRRLCERHTVEVADFSGSEDELYFLRDVMHLGWRGWIHVEEVLYDFSRS